MDILISWLLVNALLGAYYNIMIYKSDEWYDILLLPLLARGVRNSGFMGAYHYFAYIMVVLFSLPYIIVHYTFLVIWTIVVLIIDSIREI